MPRTNLSFLDDLERFDRAPGGRPWWRDGVIYQCFPRSFADANGDGSGDLRGVIDRLDHLEWLGVEGLWLNPIHPSPNADWGYDVTDYRAVHPELGTLADVDELIAEAGRRGIALLLDLVPNHTSDRHPWFEAALRDPDSPFRRYYVWRDPAADGGPPNNWVSMFGGPAWTLDDASGQYYLHNFLPSQPDLNWWNPEVRAEFDEIMRFWLDRGVAGFRIDVAHGIVKDRLLRDNPPARETDRESWRLRGQQAVYSMNRPEVHDVLKRFRRTADAYDPPRVLLGETLVHSVEQVAEFYGDDDDELHLALNFPFTSSELSAPELRAIVRRTERLLGPDNWPTWTLSNHDLVRFPTRWAAEDEAKIRCALMLLLTLRGTPILYYGDEIGMVQSEVPAGLRRDPRPIGRDGARTPMPWSTAPGAGFTTHSDAWLPIDVGQASVACQRDERDSVLHLVRDLISLRRVSEDLAAGDYVELPAADDTWVFRRGAAIVVALNMSDRTVEVETGRGGVVLSTSPAQPATAAVGGRLRLHAWSGVIMLAD